MSAKVELMLGDCLERMQEIPDGSVDFICDDLPYGVLNSQSEGGKWDCVIPMEPMWEQFGRVLKPNGAVVLFAQGMFTAQLMMSQPKAWKYNLVYDKVRSSGFLNANRMPLRSHEDICVFYRELPTFNPQKVKCEPGKETHSRGKLDKAVTNTCYGKRVEVDTADKSMKCPGSILRFPKPPPSENVHPTQKPVDLCRWLIRTYTNEGDTVLDATAGSGTTAVAAVLEGRNVIAIEKEQKYYDVMCRRVKDAQETPRQGELWI